MNVANLQLQGLMVALASINATLVRKGVLSIDEIDLALSSAQSNILGDERAFEDLSPALRDAACFPIRLLKFANLGQSEDHIQSFSELAREVGKLKERYNDQR